MNREFSFLCKTFQLTALHFEAVKLVSVPGGGVGEEDEFGFSGGDDFKTEGECIVIIIDMGSVNRCRQRQRRWQPMVEESEGRSK